MPVVAFLGDVMLGRGVGEVIARDGVAHLFSSELLSTLHEADAVVANLECCISARGERWPDPEKPFFFRAPPAAVDALTALGMSAVTLANNHALDYGRDALVDTLTLLHEAGIATTGAGTDVAAARQPARLRVRDLTLHVIGCTDHPVEYQATETAPGVAYAELHGPLDQWVVAAISAHSGGIVVVTPHWGPNMVGAPTPRVRQAARALIDAGTALVAGHSAHVFHGASHRVLHDLGDFVDDYATHPDLRNDLGLVFFVELAADGPHEVAAVPIALDYCHTRLAKGDDAAWVRARFTAACAALGTDVVVRDGRLVVDMRGS